MQQVTAKDTMSSSGDNSDNHGGDHVAKNQDAPPDAKIQQDLIRENDSSSQLTEDNWLRSIWDFFESKSRSVNIGHLLLVLLGLHLFAMSFPNSASIFDESYYVGTYHFDQDLLNLIPSNLEHPFFGKIWGALGIYLFGDNFFGWRIFYVLIGILTVWVFYELALVFFSKGKALFAASLLGFETLFFIHTTAALLEGTPLLFGLLGFLLYFKKKYYLSAIAFGLSILSKEWGLYFVIALFLYHVYFVIGSKPLSRKAWSKFIIFVAILALVVSLPLWAYDTAYHPISSNGTPITNPIQNFEYYYSYQTSLKISANDALDPWHFAWNWINPLTVSPDTYYAESVTFSVNTTLPNGTSYNRVTLVTTPIDYLGIGNLVIWYSIWAIVPFIILKPLISKKLTKIEAFVGSWILATYGPSLLLSAVIHRVVYAFYFINVDPGLALGIPMLISFIAPKDSFTERALIALWLGAAIVFFFIFFPVRPVPGL